MVNFSGNSAHSAAKIFLVLRPKVQEPLQRHAKRNHRQKPLNRHPPVDGPPELRKQLVEAMNLYVLRLTSSAGPGQEQEIEVEEAVTDMFKLVVKEETCGECCYDLILSA